MRNRFTAWLLALTVAGTAHAGGPKKLLLLSQGPDGHPPETHEYGAGQRILHKLLTQASKLDVEVVGADEPWRDGPELLAKADGAVLFISEGAKWVQADPKRHAAFQDSAKRRGGLVTLHWAMGTRDQKNVDGFVALFGGCHGGPERKYKVVTAPTQFPDVKHPIAAGLKAFEVRDEFYYKLWQAPGAEAVLKVVIDGKPETVAWAWQRPDGGRSFGFSGLHFHQNWAVPEYRRLVVQGVLWAMREPVPADGVKVSLDPGELKVLPK